MMQKESPTEAAVFTNGQLRVDYAAGCAYLNDEVSSGIAVTLKNTNATTRSSTSKVTGIF